MNLHLRPSFLWQELCQQQSYLKYNKYAVILFYISFSRYSIFNNVGNVYIFAKNYGKIDVAKLHLHLKKFFFVIYVIFMISDLPMYKYTLAILSQQNQICDIYNQQCFKKHIKAQNPSETHLNYHPKQNSIVNLQSAIFT